MPAPGARRYQQAIAIRDKRVFAALERRRREGGESNDLISMLMNMVDAETNAQMTDQQLRDEAVSLFLAGYETAATMLTWTYHMLTQAPHLAQKLQAEVDEVLGQRLPTFDDLHHLGYTRRLAQRFELSAVPGRVARTRFSAMTRTRDGVWVKLALRR